MFEVMKIRKNLVDLILLEMKAQADPGFSKSAGVRFGIHAENYLGVCTPEIYRIADSYYLEIKDLDTERKFEYCEMLLDSGVKELKYTAFRWAYRFRKEFKPHHFAILERWLNHYIRDWADCDFISTKVIGEYFLTYPDDMGKTLLWAKSPDRWLRRSAAVSLILPAKRRGHLAIVFALARILLQDTDDLVQKGYGWLLKAAADNHQAEVFKFVMAHKSKMPRTALRYAIEKMPVHLKEEAMDRNPRQWMLE
jgi:3-methyladenine DNA glycosylase AlkD